MLKEAKDGTVFFGPNARGNAIKHNKKLKADAEAMKLIRDEEEITRKAAEKREDNEYIMNLEKLQLKKKLDEERSKHIIDPNISSNSKVTQEEKERARKYMEDAQESERNRERRDRFWRNRRRADGLRIGGKRKTTKKRRKQRKTKKRMSKKSKAGKTR